MDEVTSWTNWCFANSMQHVEGASNAATRRQQKLWKYVAIIYMLNDAVDCQRQKTVLHIQQALKAIE